MKTWLLIVSIAVPTCVTMVLVVVLVLLFLRRRSGFFGSHKVNNTIEVTGIASGIAKLHQSYKAAASVKNSTHRFHHLHESRSLKVRSRNGNREEDDAYLDPFYWKDNPNLVSKAVQEGWSRFRFSSLIDLSSDDKMPTDQEVVAGSSDLMQAVRLNPGRTSKIKQKKKRRMKKKKGPWCVWMMDFPLPGPVSEDTYFPQDSYFEITILYLQSSRILHERDKEKLIRQQKTKSPTKEEKEDAPMQRGERDDGNDGKKDFDEDDGGHGDGFVSVGLTRGGFPPDKKPGNYSGSICFDSDGSVFLQGKRLVREKEESQWSSVNSVIGCGFNPSKKKVIFTLDSKLIHVVHCRSDVFACPLYPCLASNTDAMVLVNLGQRPFKYPPANAHRTPNPGSVCPPAFGRDDPDLSTFYDVSGELFSMEWPAGYYNGDVLQGEGDRSSGINNRKRDRIDDDGCVVVDINDADSDLFEISLNSRNEN